MLDSLSAQMNVPDTKFSRNTMKLLNHNASTLIESISCANQLQTKVGLEAYLAYLFESINYANQLRTNKSEAWGLISIIDWVNQLC